MKHRPCLECSDRLGWWRSLTRRSVCFTCDVASLVVHPLPSDYFDTETQHEQSD